MSSFILLTVAAIIIVGIALGIDPKIYLLVAIYVLLFGIFINAPTSLLLAYMVIIAVLFYIQYRESKAPAKTKKGVWQTLMEFVNDSISAGNNTDTPLPKEQRQALPQRGTQCTLRSIIESRNKIPNPMAATVELFETTHRAQQNINQ